MCRFHHCRWRAVVPRTPRLVSQFTARIFSPLANKTKNRLSTRSQYFNTVCDGRFAVSPPPIPSSHHPPHPTNMPKETEKRTLTLPESPQTISTLLQEIYGVYNPTTGSLFISFALRRAMEKEVVMADLLCLFLTADKVLRLLSPPSLPYALTPPKYNLETIKLKAAEAIIDRLLFLSDPLSIVDLASSIFDDGTPALDCGLRAAIVTQLHVRMPAIIQDEDAWEEYAGNGRLVKALHARQCGGLEEGRGGMLSPPATPTKKRKVQWSECV